MAVIPVLTTIAYMTVTVVVIVDASSNIIIWHTWGRLQMRFIALSLHGISDFAPWQGSSLRLGNGIGHMDSHQGELVMYK